MGRKSRANKVEFSGTVRTDEVDDYGLESDIPLRDALEAEQQAAAGMPAYDPMDRATLMLTGLIQLDRELRVATAVQALATYATDKRITLSGSSQFSDYTNSDPINVIKTALSATFIVRPNVMVLGRPAFDVVSSHPHLVNAIKGNTTGRGIVTAEEIARLFGLREVIVGDAFNNTARLGQAGAYSRLWGKHIALIHLASSPDPMGVPTFGFTARWGTRLVKTKQDDDMGLRGGSTVLVGESVKEVIAARDAGYLIQNAVAYRRTGQARRTTAAGPGPAGPAALSPGWRSPAAPPAAARHPQLTGGDHGQADLRGAQHRHAQRRRQGARQQDQSRRRDRQGRGGHCGPDRGRRDHGVRPRADARRCRSRGRGLERGRRDQSASGEEDQGR
jgi:hypothetical protein